MTTSVLKTHGRYLNSHDLQTLRDYALEAPYEWRMAFEQLVEAAERAWKLDDVQEERDEARGELKEVKLRLEKVAAELDALIPGEGTEAAKFLAGMPWSGVKLPPFRDALQKVHEKLENLHEGILNDKEKKP